MHFKRIENKFKMHSYDNAFGINALIQINIKVRFLFVNALKNTFD